MRAWERLPSARAYSLYKAQDLFQRDGNRGVECPRLGAMSLVRVATRTDRGDNCPRLPLPDLVRVTTRLSRGDRWPPLGVVTLVRLSSIWKRGDRWPRLDVVMTVTPLAQGGLGAIEWAKEVSEPSSGRRRSLIHRMDGRPPAAVTHHPCRHRCRERTLRNSRPTAPCRRPAPARSRRRNERNCVQPSGSGLA